jgi:malate dehydrogenase
LFGVTTLDVVRAKTFVGQVKNLDPTTLNINVIGGHSGVTIIPLLSQIKGVTFTKDEIDKLTHRIQFGGDEVVKAKAGAGSATLSMAFAAREFTVSLLKALRGDKKQIQAAYVHNNGPYAPYFASQVTLGPSGAEKIHPVGPLSDYEKKLVDAALPELRSNIEKGEQFAKSKQ